LVYIDINAETHFKEERMQIRKFVISAVVLCAVLALTGCGAAATTTMDHVAAPAATQAPEAVLPESSDMAGQRAPAVMQAPNAGLSSSSDTSGQAAPAPAATSAAVVQTGPNTITNNTGSAGHMIVKNGNVKLLVKDTDRALDGVTQIVGDVQGYIVSSRVWYQDYYGTNYKYATLTMGVPVDQFENAILRLRGLSIRVLDENATGQDVTDQYVDLQSQMTNLEATRDRIKGFLDQAKTVDDALRINQQLSDVEAQIEQIKGKMNYFSNRSAFSTITIDLEPDLPPVVMTPTPTPTPTPIQPLSPWDPGKTTQNATNALVSIYRVIIDFLIWIFVVLVPILAPPILIIWLILRLVKKRSQSTTKA
jgi:hypothetical protein